MSDVINDVADVVYEMVSVNPSRRQLEIEQLMKKEGLSYEEAYRQWTHDHTLEYIKDVAGGMLSGGIMAGGAMGTNAIINNTAAGANIMQYGRGNKRAVKAEIQSIIDSAAKEGQTINKKQANVIRLNRQMNNGGLRTGNAVYDALVENGLNSTDESVRKQAQKLAVMRDQNGRQSLTGIGKLQNFSLRANTNVAVGTATQMLESVGTPVNVIEAVTGAIKGEELSKKEIKRIQSSPDAMSVMMQLYETATGEAVNLDEHSSADEIREVAGRLYGTTFETDNTQAGKLYSMAAAMRANGDIGFNGVKGFMSGYRENLNMSLEEYANMFKLAYNESKAGKSPEAIAEHIHSIFAANEADEATTAARDTAVLRAALTAQNDIEHENKQAKKEKKEAKQEAEEDVTDNLHSKSGLEEDISEEDSVTKEAVESAKKLSRLSESEKADKYKNGGAIVESTKKLTTQQSAIISFYDYRGKKHGITYRFVDVIESNKGARGEYNHQTEVITIRIGTVADMTATAGHELGHWLKAHYPEEYEQMQQYLKDTVFKTNYEAKVAAKIAAYKKADITIDKEAGFVIDTNKLASVYGKGGFENYIQNEIKNGNLVRIKNRSNQVGERTAPIAGSYGSNTSNNSISDSSKKSNSSFQVSDSDYLEAARNGDEAKAAEYVEQAAKEWGAFSDGKPEPINLYHGTKSFGFTEFDLKKMDDGQSIYMTSDIETAQSYSGTTRKTRISNADKIVDYSVLSKEELADSLNEYIDTLNVGKGYDEIINTEYEYWNKEDIDYFLSHHNEFDSAYNNLQYVFEKSKESLEDGAIIETNGIENEKIISKQEANEILKNARITNRGNYSLYAKFENPLIVDCKGADWNIIPADGFLFTDESGKHYKTSYATTREFSKSAKISGYDGVIFKNIYDNGGRGIGEVYTADYIAVAFDSSQVKSADPITYDGNGEIIPLSERFSESKDIRYSVPDKQEQFDIIQKANPAEDDYHTWIRSVDDIRTYDEIMSEIADADEFGGTDDYTYSDAKTALQENRVVVYSSKPIANGIFVTPSETEAKSFAGNSAIYSKPVALSDVAWIDEIQGQYAKANQSERKYSYEYFINKSPMKITTVDDSKQYPSSKIARNSAVNNAMKGAAQIGRKNEKGNVFVAVDDIQTDVMISKKSLRHSLDRRLSINAPVVEKIGTILKNAIRVNELNPRTEEIEKSYALIGIAKNSKNEPYVVSFVVNGYSNELMSMDILYSVNAKKEATGLIDPELSPQSGGSLTASTISISDLLELVNEYFPDHLPEDVLKHFDHEARPEGVIGESALYQISDTTLTPEQQAAIERKAQRREMSKFQRENDELKEALAAARQQRILSKDYRHNKSQTPKIAKRLLRQMSVIDLSDAERERFIDALDYLYDTIDDNKLENSGGSDVTLMAAMEAVDIIRNRIQYTEKYEELAGRAQEFADYFKGRTYISEAQAKELRYHFGGVDKANQLVHGLNFATAKGGETTLDMQWREIMETFPDFINEELTDTDEPLAIIKAMQDAREMIDGTLYSPFEVEKLAERAAGEDLESIDFAEAELMNDLAMKLIDSYSDAEWKATFADRKKVQKTVALIKQKQKFRESMRKWRIKTRESEKNKAQKGLNAYKAKVAESRKKATERKRQTELKNKIKKIAFELGSMAANPNKKKHIPNGLVTITHDFLSMLETGDVTQDRLNNYVASMREEFKEVEKSHLYDSIMDDYNATLRDMLDELETGGKNLNLKRLTSAELEKVLQIARTLKQSVSFMNKFFFVDKNRTVSEYQNSVVAERRGKVNLKSKEWLQPIKEFGINELKPVYFFENTNSPTLLKLYEGLRRGQTIWSRDMSEAKIKVNECREKYGYDKWDLHKKYKFKLANSEVKEVELNLLQIMSLKAYSEREAGINHLLDGGFKLRNGSESRRFFTDKFKRVIDKTTYRLTPAEFQAIIATLTPQQVAYVHEMRDYLAQDLSKKGNEVSRKMWDMELFNEEKYFPIKTDGDFNKMGELTVVDGKKLKNWGASKPLIPHAHNPLVLEEFNDVWSRHVNEMAQYHAFTLPLEDFQKVYGYFHVLTAEQEKELRKNYSDQKAFDHVPDTQERKQLLGGFYDQPMATVSIRSMFDDAEQRYIYKFLSDLNGGVKKADETLSSRGISKYKKMATAMNLRVTVQQPGALARAFLYISPKYFVKTTGSGLKGIKSDSNAVKEMEKYADAAFIKSLGYFDIDTGRTAEQFLNENNYNSFKQKAIAFVLDGEYRDEKMLFAPEMMDRVTWLHIWNATKAKVAAEEHLDGKELLKRTGEVFNDVVDKTQVYDSVFTRSGHMRSNSPLAKMMTSFLAEPTTTLNMYVNAFTQWKRGNVKKSFVAKAFASCFTATLLTNLLASVVSAMRHGKDDDNWWELWVGEFTSDFLTDIVMVNSIPLIRDLFNLAKGWDVERADMTLASNFINAVKKLTKAQQENKVTYKEWLEFCGATAALADIPVSSLKKDIFGIFQSARTISNGTSPTFEGFKKALYSGWTDASAIDDILSLQQPSTNKYDMIYQLYAAGKYDKADARMEALIKKELESTKPEYGESEAEMEKRIREKIESGWESYIKQQMFDKSEFETIYQFMLNSDTKKAVEMKKSLLKESLENVVLMKDEKKEQGQARVKEYFEKTYQSFMQGKLKDKKEIVSAAKVLSAGNLNQAKTAIANLTKQGFTEEDVLKSIYHNINAQIPEGEDFSRDGAIFRVSYSRSLEANALVNTKSMKAAALADIDHDIKTRVRIQNSLRNIGYKQDDIRRATDYLKSQLKNDSEEDDEDEEKSIFKASDLGWATLKADTATIRVCAKGYTEFYLKTHKAKTKEDEEEIKKAARKNIRTQISKIVKDEYYKASSTRRKQIHQLMLSSGAYDNGDAVLDVCNGWVKQIAKKKFGN